jgi:hypothetical protein
LVAEADGTEAKVGEHTRAIIVGAMRLVKIANKPAAVRAALGQAVVVRRSDTIARAVGDRGWHGRTRVHVHATNFGERVALLGDVSHRVRELARLLPRCVAQ